MVVNHTGPFWLPPPTTLDPPNGDRLYRPVRKAHRPQQRPPPHPLRERQAVVPSDPIIPFHPQGDGTGVEHLPAPKRVPRCAVEGPTAAKRRIRNGSRCSPRRSLRALRTINTCPRTSLTAIEAYGVAIKGPLTTAARIGGGIRSINRGPAARSSTLCCVRPCRYYAAHPQPRTNGPRISCDRLQGETRDIYMGTRRGPPMIPVLRSN